MISCLICDCYTFNSLCADCRPIRHCVTVYGKDRVIDALHRLFFRTPDKQKHKEREILKEQLKDKEESVKAVK